MPATYSHKGKGSADYKPRTSIFQKPEPPKMYSIGGLSVDEATYRKYNREDYQLGDGALRNLRGVMLYAESAELAAEYPETAEAAKKIIAEITAEITGKGAENTMNNPITARGYVDALHKIYTESRDNYAAQCKKVEEKKGVMDRYYETAQKERTTLANARYEAAKAEYNAAKLELSRAYKETVREYESRVDELRSQFASSLYDRYSASPDKLDSATIQLLNTGICTPAELSRLTERHKDNPTMLRILGSHADQMLESKNKYSIDAINALYAVQSTAKAVSDGSRELNVYDQANAVLRQALREDQKSAEWFDSQVEKDWGTFQTTMDELSGSSAATAE